MQVCCVPSFLHQENLLLWARRPENDGRGHSGSLTQNNHVSFCTGILSCDLLTNKSEHNTKFHSCLLQTTTIFNHTQLILHKQSLHLLKGGLQYVSTSWFVILGSVINSL